MTNNVNDGGGGSTNYSSRGGALSPPITPVETTSGDTAGPLGPDTPHTPRFAAFMDFISRPSASDAAVTANAADETVSDADSDDFIGNVNSPNHNDEHVSLLATNEQQQQHVGIDNSSSDTQNDDPTTLGSLDAQQETVLNNGSNGPNDPNMTTISASSAPISNPTNNNANRKQPVPPVPYQPADYQYSNRYSSPTMATNYTSSNDTKNRIGKRCYRLNLERPLDIHCEQSPLEYGDYMTPWTKAVYPKTVGPTEYCPPRHLGGREDVWRDLMRWSNNSEEKVNSLDVLDNAVVDDDDDNNDDGEVVQQEVSKTTVSPGEGYSNANANQEEEKRGESADEIQIIETSAKQQPSSSAREEQAKKSTNNNPKSPTGGWRSLSSSELLAVQKLNDRNDQGELTFQTYDLSHVALNTTLLKTANGSRGDTQSIVRVDKSTGKSGILVRGVGIIPLRTVFSMDSTTSEDERLHPKTPDQMANDTARLFRRSELSVREKQEGEERAEAERQECLRKEEIARQEREKAAREKETETGLLSDDGPLDSSARRGGKKGHSRRFSSGGKKLFRTLSKAFGDSTTVSSRSNLEASWRGSASRGRSGSASGSGGRPSMSKRSSMQALTIDKARDLVDESDDEGSVVGDNEGGDGDEAKKKPLNVSLYILGEYDTLIDLTYDGAKRLRDNKTSSDLNLLHQNDPCPPPDRWVRETGWSKCNPSSMYAKVPPKDFDWVRYYDQLRLRTEEYKVGFKGHKGGAAGKEASFISTDKLPGTITDTQTTETTAAVSCTSDLSEDERHHVGGRLTRVTRASSSSSPHAAVLAPQAKSVAPTNNPNTHRGTTAAVGARSSAGAKSHYNTARATSDNLSSSARPSSSSSSGGGAKSHFNTARATSDNLSASARPSSSSSSGAKSHFNTGATTTSDNLSASARAPQRSGSTGSAVAARGNNKSKGGFGRKMSSMLGRKKSGGVE
eukprot:CAMPEP_0172315512 /NCGR_PEP_ID=MMETSP1058-20130122/25412_1 /TAXON_ID=83371 /ORGANISM="Detonula confervacea, Strain CCMP 353" /LENGTH=961 /DNA_ID=CAMNT_0013029597 /DNA_START=494 /DNA_END=3382 /DNA_ORIENTATION=-